MKIICVEEHIIDQDLAKAGQPRREADAPYFTEVGSGDSGAMEDGDEQRPLPMDISMTLSSLQRQARNVSRKWISTASTCRFSSAAIPPERAARAGIRTYASG